MSNNPINFSSSLAVLVFLILMPSPLWSIMLMQECQKQCDESRPMGNSQSFKFTCDNAYKTESDREVCRERCEFCPREVCDETIDANNWHCPSTDLNDECKSLCNKHRNGRRESYILNCDTLDSDNDQVNCKITGYHLCPRYVFRDSEPNILYCPDEKFEGSCRDECNKARQHGEVGIFSFKCDEKYSEFSPERRSCQDSCGSDCPSWVCNWLVDSNAYTCPSLKLDGDCSNYCENNRPPSKPTEAYKLNCKILRSSLHYDWEDKCKEDCSYNCGRFTSGGNAVCDSSNATDFYCPPKEKEDISPPNFSGRSYKGACKEYCEKNRGGGFREFSFDCEERFSSPDERHICKTICENECPEEVCPNLGNSLFCPANQKELEKEEGKTRHKIEHLMDELQSERIKNEDHERAVKEELVSERSKRLHVIVVLVILVALFVLSVAAYLCYRKRRNDRLQQQVQPHPDQQQQSQHPHQPQFPHSQWSEASYMMDQRLNSAFGGQHAAPHHPKQHAHFSVDSQSQMAPQSGIPSPTV